MRLRILPYNMTSESARVIARGLGVLRVYPDDRSRFVPRRSDVVINWGCSRVPMWLGTCNHVLNHPLLVRLAVNKLTCMRTFKESTIPSPDWTEERSVAESWITQGNRVYCRTMLQGKGGEGIVIATSLDEIVDAKLYTKGVQNEKEYRVHVFDGRVIDYSKKGRKRDSEERASHLIRNHASGWVFIREGIQLPEVVAESAIRAVASLGLTFGAVDVCTLKGTQEQECVVFEVNTSPGMSKDSTTSYRYVEAIREYFRRCL